MLANSPDTPAQVGTLGRDVQRPATFGHELLDFIAGELPYWRDSPDRPRETAETILTSQLCAYLNGVARHSAGWDILQFKVEEVDEQNKGRKVDLVAAPCGVTITIEGRRHTQFETLMPIECKRLPIPTGKRLAHHFNGRGGRSCIRASPELNPPHDPEHLLAPSYGRRVRLLRIFAVKKSKKRSAALASLRNRAGGLPSASS